MLQNIGNNGQKSHFFACNFGLKLAFLYEINTLAPFENKNAKNDTKLRAARSEMEK